MWKHIETYIDDHREELDQHNPPGGLWAHIESELDLDRPARVRLLAAFDNWLRLAAAIVLIVGGAWLWLQVTPEAPQNMSSLLPVIHEINQASEEWNQAEAEYVDQVWQLQLQLDDGWQDSEIYQKLAPSLEQVKSELQEIRQAHHAVTNQDSLLSELIQAQQKHLRLLKRLSPS